MAEQMDALTIFSCEGSVIDFECLKISTRNNYLLILQDLVKYRTKHSALEILLILHRCLNYSNIECCCYLEMSIGLHNITFWSEYITLMKDMMEFVTNVISKNLVADFDSQWKCDYHLQLLYLFRFSFCFIDEKIEILNSHREESQQRMKNDLHTKLKQITNTIDVLFSRHGLHYRQEMLQYRQAPQAGPLELLPTRHRFFQHYEYYASIGKFPHIFWQETALSEKINHYDSLKAIFFDGKEEMCCICTTDGEDFKNHFAIFLECKHLVCSSCADKLLVDNKISRRCPICRTDIKCWTTKKFVQLALDEQKQHEDDSILEGQHEYVSLAEQKQEDVSLAEQKHEDVLLAEQKQQVSLREGQKDVAEPRQQELPRKLNKPKAGISKMKNYEFCRFDSLNIFLNCLECLNAVKSELSLIEILLLLHSNISIFMCTSYRNKIIQISTAPYIIEVLQNIATTIRYVQTEASRFRLTTRSEGRMDIEESYLLFWEIMHGVFRITEATEIAFPSAREQIFDHEKAIFMMLQEIHHFFECKLQFPQF